MTDDIDIRTVRTGDIVEFENRGQRFGGIVWRSPSSGDLIAGDTFLTVNGRWLPSERVVSITRRREEVDRG